ncbi:MAG: hypothetical protein IAB08_08505 [Bacteroidetes bacterium]|uniref:ATP-dependent DNA helicase RecG C-terminal domain-containing protein n=1 Tax=Candidatus Pullibacteroides excrementavium TaxID=2840905 RepID=A0A9D9H3F7_9BACT|nr:hypothetical protein [Candidatus Pullibacteroides excrementavium]
MSEKETNCRNPILQKMFMRLGRAEKAGSGVDKIMSGWHFLGWPNPSVREETRPDYVVLSMPIGKPDKKTGQEKPFITNESQENPARKPDKKTRQENPTRRSKECSKSYHSAKKQNPSPKYWNLPD